MIDTSLYMHWVRTTDRNIRNRYLRNMLDMMVMNENPKIWEKEKCDKVVPIGNRQC